MTGKFPSQKASNTENVSIWWRHVILLCDLQITYCVPNVRNVDIVDISQVIRTRYWS